MKFAFFFLLVICSASFSFSQDKDENNLPYYQIPDYPKEYTAETVVARMIDGLGFRYYWATESLRDDDLEFRPNEDARTSMETLKHIYGLSRVIIYPVKKEAIPSGGGSDEMDFIQLRSATLLNLKTASELLKSGKVALEDCKIIFTNPNGNREYPFWNNLNGPIADALWHTGQVVSFRRSSGNPFNSKVSVFSGKVRE